MKKLTVILVALVFSMGIVGCKGEPTCEEVCGHVIKIMSDGDEDMKKMMEGEKGKEFLKDCAEDCGKQFDDEAKKCFMGTKTEDDMKKCEKEARKRRKAAKKDKEGEKKEEAK